jgi:hypothetical protein
MSVVTELGFPAATMANIFVVWGTVRFRSDPLPVGTPTAPTQTLFPPPANMAFPTWAAPGWIVAAPAAAPAGGGAVPFIRMIDGNPINLEQLLIRLIMMRLGAGGTVSNNLLMAPIAHPQGVGAVGAVPIRVKFHLAPFGPYAGFTRADSLNPGFVW